MIANPDWSLFTVDPTEEDCCHKTLPIGAESAPIFSVPYERPLRISPAIAGDRAEIRRG